MSMSPQDPGVRTDDLRVVQDEGQGEAAPPVGRSAQPRPDLRVEDAQTQGDAAARARDTTAQASDTELLTGQQRSNFEARWRDVQTAFVDEPRGAVDRADALVGEVVEAVAAGFSARRSQLERRWSAEGEEAATEDLRQALRAYREFFDRLLKI